jgi:hypothetical protein
MIIAKVGNMTNQTGVSGPHSIAYCLICGNEFSANKSDYWDAPDSLVLKCCYQPMHLVVKKTVYSHADSLAQVR